MRASGRTDFGGLATLRAWKSVEIGAFGAVARIGADRFRRNSKNSCFPPKKFLIFPFWSSFFLLRTPRFRRKLSLIDFPLMFSLPLCSTAPKNLLLIILGLGENSLQIDFRLKQAFYSLSIQRQNQKMNDRHRRKASFLRIRRKQWF